MVTGTGGSPVTRPYEKDIDQVEDLHQKVIELKILCAYNLAVVNYAELVDFSEKSEDPLEI
jgi:hypothetical protein